MIILFKIWSLYIAYIYIYYFYKSIHIIYYNCPPLSIAEYTAYKLNDEYFDTSKRIYIDHPRAYFYQTKLKNVQDKLKFLV